MPAMFGAAGHLDVEVVDGALASRGGQRGQLGRREAGPRLHRLPCPRFTEVGRAGLDRRPVGGRTQSAYALLPPEEEGLARTGVGELEKGLRETHLGRRVRRLAAGAETNRVGEIVVKAHHVRRTDAEFGGGVFEHRVDADAAHPDRQLAYGLGQPGLVDHRRPAVERAEAQPVGVALEDLEDAVADCPGFVEAGPEAVGHGRDQRLRRVQLAWLADHEVGRDVDGLTGTHARRGHPEQWPLVGVGRSGRQAERAWVDNLLLAPTVDHFPPRPPDPRLQQVGRVLTHQHALGEFSESAQSSRLDRRAVAVGLGGEPTGGARPRDHRAAGDRDLEAIQGRDLEVDHLTESVRGPSRSLRSRRLRS